MIEIFSIAQSPFPIEKINITHTYPQFSPSAESHEEFVNKLSQNETIYAVRIFSAEQGTEIASDNPELTNEKANEAIKIHLIYWPSKLKQELEGIKPTGIAGGYQIDKEGTNLGYLLILPAALIDFTAFAIAVGVYGLLYAPMHMTGN